MKPYPLLLSFALTLAFTLLPHQSYAQDEEALIFTTPEGWRGETIALPPKFAPDMKLEGSEVIRFAPGMFDPESESFFSYIFVFSAKGEAVFSEEAIRNEILIYYRGLATSVLKGKGKKVDTDKFTFEMEKSEKAAHSPDGASENEVTEYRGSLDWIEPFATAKPQKLAFEIHAWSDPKTKRSYLVAGTSPRPLGDDEPIWKDLREIRAAFAIGDK